MLTNGIGLELLEFVLFIHRSVERVDICIYCCSSEKGFFLYFVMLGMWRLYGTKLVGRAGGIAQSVWGICFAGWMHGERRALACFFGSCMPYIAI